MKRILLIVAIGVFLMFTGNANASYSFYNITNNTNVDLSGQLNFNVSVAGDQVTFTVNNAVGIPSAVTEIYLDDNASVLKTSNNPPVIVNTGGASFVPGATPANLPGGENINFSANVMFSSQADTPPPREGLNSSGKYVSLTYYLQQGKDLSSVVTALQNQSLRLGLHVTSISGGSPATSDSYVSTPIPAAVWLLGSGLVGLFGVRRRFMS